LASSWQAAEKDPYASLCSIASRQRTADVRLRSAISRAPCLWIFLSSLQEIFFSNWRSDAATEKKNSRKERKGRKKMNRNALP